MKRAICILLLTALHTFAYASDGLVLSTVVIDPGHGGKDPGAVSKDNKTYEKTIVLDISKKLAEKIRNTYPDVKVILTRDSDDFVSLDGRAEKANKADANLFISIHINSSTSPSPNGYSMHVLGQSSNKDKDLFAYNMDVCKLENSVISLEDDVTKYEGLDPDDPESQIFAMLMQSAFLEQSLKFAQIVSDNMKNGPIRSGKGVWQDPFYVLWKTSMPAVLVELGFMSNSADITSLKKSESREEIASRLFSAFKEYKTSYDGLADVVVPTEPVVVKETVAVPEKAVAAKEKKVIAQKDSVSIVKEKAVVSTDTALTEKKEKAVVPTDTVKITKQVQVIAQADTVAEKKQLAVNEASVKYGVQIFAVNKILYPGAKEFLGYKPSVFKVGSINKYVIGIDEDINVVRKNLKEIKNKYSDAFIVKITGDKIEIFRK